MGALNPSSRNIHSGKIGVNLRVCCPTGDLGHFNIPPPELVAEGGGGALGV